MCPPPERAVPSTEDGGIDISPLVRPRARWMDRAPDGVLVIRECTPSRLAPPSRRGGESDSLDLCHMYNRTCLFCSFMRRYSRVQTIVLWAVVRRAEASAMFMFSISAVFLPCFCWLHCSSPVPLLHERSTQNQTRNTFPWKWFDNLRCIAPAGRLGGGVGKSTYFDIHSLMAPSHPPL